MLLGLNQRTYGSSCHMSIVVGGLCVPYDPKRRAAVGESPS